ncbi:MAG: hypothetical protein WCY90_00785 [Bacilli bacterium]
MKKKLFIGLAAATLLLTGCDKISAKPVDIEKTVLVDELSNIVNNTLEKIYKNYHDSNNFKQYVLDEVLLKVAEHEFKPYAELAADDAFKLSVDKRAKHKFYSEITSGSYTYRSVFDEKKYVIERVYRAENSYIVDADGNPVSIGALDSVATGFYKSGIFLPTVDKDNFDDPAFELVHFDYYKHYIKEKFIDTIYREKLVEKYVQNEQKTTLGRNYARHVEYVAIKNNANHPTAASALVNAFIDNNILGPNDADLNILANAWRGVVEDYIGNEAALLTQTNLVSVVPGSEHNHTLFGDVENDYSKIKTNPDLTDTTIENRFTGNGTYPKEIGLEIEKNEVRKQKFVTSEWGIKNGGLGGLPESIRTRLFNIGVANGVDFVRDDLGILANAGKWVGDDTDSRLPNTFVRNINGSYYLVPKTFEKGNNRNFLFFENDTFYIIKVKEAVNTAKLATGEDGSYTDLGRTPEAIAEIIDEVTYHLAQISSTKTNALNHFMEDLDVVFHDEKVKEFFETEFPEVFGEKDKK